MQTYISDKELAKRFALSRPTIWRWVKEGLFPEPIKLSAGCTRWRLSDVEAFEASRQEQPDELQ